MKKLFFALITSFLFVASSWGQCYSEDLQSTVLEISSRNIVVFQTDFINHPVKKVSFKAKRDATGIGNLYLEQYIDGSWYPTWDANPGVVTKTFIGVETAVDYANYEVTIDNRATAIRFKTDGVLSYKKYLKNVILEYVPDYTIIPTDSKDFGVVSLNSDNNKTIKVEYSSITSDLTVKLAQQDNVFSTSLTGTSTNPVTIAYADCSYGSKDITIYFKPTEYGVYTNQLEFSNGTKVFLRGECSHDFDSKAANFTVEKVSYTSIKLKWNAVPGASGYRIVNQTNGASYTVDANTTSLNATGLKMETNYSFVFYALFNGATSLNATLVSATTLKKEGVVIEDCPKFYENYDAKEQTIGVVGYNEPMIYDNISITGNLPSYKVRFRAKMTTGSVVGKPDLCMYVKLKGKDNYEPNVYWEGRAAGLDDTHREYFVEVPQNTVAIKFDCDENGATLKRHLDDLYIFSENILEANKTELDFGEVKPNEYKDLSVNLTYSNVAKLETMLDSEYFTIQSFKETAACTDGTQQVVIRFQPTACFSEYEESLTIFNGQELAITLKGKLERNPGTVSEITWTGAVDTNWDNRANWIKADGNVLSAADVLGTNLKVNIPAGLEKYPVIPDVSTAKAFKEDRDKACDCAQVNAGDNTTATMIADKIYMESGAAIVGVETLNVGTLRYNEVEIDFTPLRCYIDDKETLRYDWTLIGPVVKPWNEDKPGETRNIVSGDYFLHDLPHVYMHKAEVKENPATGLLSAMWNESFPDLDVDLTHERAFAIRIPDQYGRNLEWWGMKFDKLPAEVYNSLFLKEGETPYDGTAPHTYTFKGRFYNDASLPTYTLPNAGELVVLNNSYPANIDAQKLKAALNREIQYYDYKNKGFVTFGTDNKSIMSQSSFIIQAKENLEKIEIKREWLETTGTAHRSASVDTESFRIELRNQAASTASEIYICHDPLKEDKLSSFDALKLFNTMEPSLPDLYAIRYSKKLSGLVIPTLSEPIPLGIYVSLEDQTFTFSLKECTLSADVILEDRQTNTQYNLSEGEICKVEGLETGLCEGRFYLLLAEQELEYPEISTGIDDALIGDIDIYTKGNSVVVSSTSDIELAQVIVSDMAGRSQVYNVSDNYAQINLPVEAGVYTINVIGDKSSRVEKIKIN